ncbi:Transposable element P transposase [Frankliniella fusca]|uniref:Transposable element P transposase n=1 Tax=Frankliniella fusca TaxID=407009 RepID=A0AAE1GV70_9NEOP|nr:Transposable element P transposase [Frankliniella fusca]
MEHYRALGDERLRDAEPTIEFIRRINSVIDAMNGQVPWQGLQADPSSHHHKVLLDFLDYLKTMNDIAILKHESVGTGKRKKKNKPHVSFEDELTTASYLGLVVTVNTAISLVKYLSQDCGFKYLMTRRINQDSLEHFFGHIRGACGANNHPDPLMFINVYRLLMTYSLIKPPRGSNVTGSEMLQALLDLKDLEGDRYKENVEILHKKIDDYLDGDVVANELFEDMDHQDALMAPIDPYALTVFGGYISRKMRKVKPAKDCLTCSLEVCAADSTPFEDRETLLQMRSRGGLLRPSSKLYNLLTKLEESVLRVSAKCSLHASFLFTVLDDLLASKEDSVAMIGCEQHQRGLTTAIIAHYLNCRMHFVCAEADRAVQESHRRNRDLAKRARIN